ncbi:hypothetical protein MPER_01107 [Moniliophthora perniciosa FA553]|nr:hypothetical protein MPER_01107 [Moniliophthora perniciosa FA553]
MFMKTPILWRATIAVTLLSFFVNADYFEPNSTGIKIQNGFERVFIQVRYMFSFQLGHSDGVRSLLVTTHSGIRVSIMRDPTGNERSALLDPPLEGPGGGHRAQA